MKKQRSDHCKYKYLMLRNGIKVCFTNTNTNTLCKCDSRIVYKNTSTTKYLMLRNGNKVCSIEIQIQIHYASAGQGFLSMNTNPLI